MPQLRSCYFCGTTGDALEEYEVVPERLVDGEAHSAVLCPDCHDKLRRVVEPFVTGSPRPDRTGRGISPHQEVTFDPAEDGATDRSSDDDAGAGGVEGLAPDLDPSETSEAASDGTSDGTTSEGDATAGRPSDGRADDGTTGDAGTGGSSAGDSSSGGGGSRRDDDVPDGYYKVLRLLQNREFPIDRSELTTLVTGAYDITERQCERILDAAVERGVLVEDGSTLDLGRN